MGIEAVSKIVPVMGSVDFVSDTAVTGWVRNAAEPSRRLTVSVKVNGGVVASTVANIFRKDLLAAVRGDGRHGFRIEFLKPVDMTAAIFECMVEDMDYSIPLGRQPKELLASVGAIVRHSRFASVNDRDEARPAGPVFIVGSPRSGTTVLGRALFSAGYHGFDEGHFLNLLDTLKEAVKRHFDLYSNGRPGQLLTNLNKQNFYELLYIIFKDLHEDINRIRPWYDKTPGDAMIRLIPILIRLWPNAVFVFCKRRSIENIKSRMRKQANKSFEMHCAEWASVMTTWRSQRNSDINAIEIDQHDTAFRPLETARALGAFLRLSEGSIKDMADIMSNHYPERTSEHRGYEISSLDSCGWNEEQIKIFKRCCSVEMDAFGYTYDESYRKN